MSNDWFASVLKSLSIKYYSIWNTRYTTFKLSLSQRGKNCAIQKNQANT